MVKTDSHKGPSLQERLLRLIYPEKCIFCGAILPETVEVSTCQACRAGLPRYGRGFERAPRIPWLNGLFASFIYENEIEQAIHAMKFFSRPRAASTLACLMAEELQKQPVMPDFDVIVPVPMHKRKQRSRGYNQSERIGQFLGQMLNVGMEGLLVKTRHTKPQSLSSREERLKNLEHAITVPNPSRVRGLNVLLVDDVVTTGATLSTCAQALHEAGAAFIFAAVIAIAGK